jgi:uncharacterized protein
MPRLRFFLDTNVLVSAVLFGGVPGSVVDAARTGEVDGIVSLHVLSEFIEVLTRARFGIEHATAVALAEEIAGFTEVVPLSVASGSWVVDRDDDPVVEAALAGRATHLVTGDARIHAVRIEHVDVVSPADARGLIENRRDS